MNLGLPVKHKTVFGNRTDIGMRNRMKSIYASISFASYSWRAYPHSLDFLYFLTKVRLLAVSGFYTLFHLPVVACLSVATFVPEARLHDLEHAHVAVHHESLLFVDKHHLSSHDALAALRGAARPLPSWRRGAELRGRGGGSRGAIYG